MQNICEILAQTITLNFKPTVSIKINFELKITSFVTMNIHSETLNF